MLGACGSGWTDRSSRLRNNAISVSEMAVNSTTCIQIRAGDCAPRSVLLLAPWFNRVDFGMVKRIDVGGSKNIEVRYDVLNLFNTPNFTAVANPGTAATIFRTTAAYTDASNTYDPGGRIGQLMFRFTW